MWPTVCPWYILWSTCCKPVKINKDPSNISTARRTVSDDKPLDTVRTPRTHTPLELLCSNRSDFPQTKWRPQRESCHLNCPSLHAHQSLAFWSSHLATICSYGMWESLAHQIRSMRVLTSGSVKFRHLAKVLMVPCRLSSRFQRHTQWTLRRSSSRTSCGIPTCSR